MRRHGAYPVIHAGRYLYLGLLLLVVVLAISLSLSAHHDIRERGSVGPTSDQTVAVQETRSSQEVLLQPGKGAVQLALQRFIESEFGEGRYVGPCENAVSPRDLWKRCTRLIADEGARLAFLEGSTFSEFVRWIFVERVADGSWRVTGTAPFDFFGDTKAIPWR